MKIQHKITDVDLKDKNLIGPSKLFSTPVVKFTLIPFVILSIILFFSLDSESWITNGTDHFYFEMMSVILSSIVAFYCILRGYAFKDKLSVFLGLGFYVASVIDFLHGMFAFLNLDQLSFESYFIPQTWVAGRLVMSIVMMLAIAKLATPREHENQQSNEYWRKKVLMYTIGLTGFGVLVTAGSLIQPFPFVTIDFIIKRPYEIIACVFFITSIFLFFRKKLHHNTDTFYNGILLSLVIDVFATLIISQSNFVFDTSFNVAHVLKNLSYFVLILTISISISNHFKIQHNLGKSLSDAYKRLETNERKYKDLYETSPNLLRTIDANGKILNCNEVYAKTLGYTKEEVIGSSIFDHVSHEDLDTIKNSFEQWKQFGHVAGLEITMMRKNGTTFPTLITASSIRNEKYELIGSNTSIIDLSEISQAKKQIQEEKLKRLTAIGELSARIAHDLRNPLSVLKNTIELLQLDLSEIQNAKVQNKFDRIKRAITRINHQVENVLDFVKEKPLKLESSSVNSVLSFVIDRINVPPNVIINMPNRDLKIMCDFEKLEIVFVNLLTNAIQMMSNKGEITIRSRPIDDNCVIEIEDTGPGIPTEHLEKIFDPLFTTRQIGTGLGLPSCKTIIEAHKGKISVTSLPGKGAIFRIELPQVQDVTILEPKSIPS